MGNGRTAISFFSGGGGLDIGLSQAGIDLAFGQDIEPDCVATLEANGRRAMLGDIREMSPEEVLDYVGIAKGEAFLVCGGPPCQPFSTAGRRRGINDPRGSLFRDYLRMIEGIRPRFFIMENVKGLLSSKLTDGDGRPAEVDGMTTVLQVILSEFSRLRYSTVYGLLDAVDFGVPQFRERFILIGSRDNEDVFLPMPTRFGTHQSKGYRWATLRDAISDLESDPGECDAFSPARSRLLDMVPPGGNWRSLPEGLQEEAMGGAYRSGGGKVGFYRRLDYDQPSPTLVTSPVQKSSMLCHPAVTRPLSVREYARIQQFPDDWVFCGNMASKYRQIGNAVPVGLGRALGEMLVSVSDGSSTVKTKRRKAVSPRGCSRWASARPSTPSTPTTTRLRWSRLSRSTWRSIMVVS